MKYNQLRPSDEEGQQRIMQQLLGNAQGEFCIITPFHCDYGYNITIGENFFANHNMVFLDGARVTFGKAIDV